MIATDQPTAYQFIYICQETDDAGSATIEVTREVADSNICIDAIVNKKSHHHALLFGEFKIVGKVFQWASCLFVKLIIETRTFREFYNLLHSFKKRSH